MWPRSDASWRMAEVCVQMNAWGDLVESFIAAMALYLMSNVKLRKFEAVRL